MTKFILGFHCHQPVGNFDFVFKEVHQKSYSPLIRTLFGLNIKFCLHASGILLEWWKENDPELIEIIAEGVNSGNIEIIGGGYYEPILAMIPPKDRLKQLEMLNEALKGLFGVYPSGAWITERIWQPDIIKDLKSAGLNYAFLDDFQFFQAGISSDCIDSVFRTEYGGEYFDIFPIHERLRYKIPFAEPADSLNEILYINGRHSNLSVMFDDGEKMGGWPDTFDWVYGKEGSKGWLENFIDKACLKNEDSPYSDIIFELPSNLLCNTEKRNNVYLPISSYREMGEWTLSPETRDACEKIKLRNPSAPLSSGIWHNFLTRYPESNLHHKRMVNLSLKIDYIQKTYGKNLNEAALELLKSQANDAYWHGVFGGIYLPHLRRAVHNALLSSYVFYKTVINEKIEIECFDFDSDGEKEFLLSNDFWCIIYKPSSASFSALDYIGKGLIHSLGDVFCLHEEYDILKIKEKNSKEESADKNIKNKSGSEDEPPKTIHDETKYPSDLSEDDLLTYKGILPPFEILFNNKPLLFSFTDIKNICGPNCNNYISIEAKAYADAYEGEAVCDNNLTDTKAECISGEILGLKINIDGGISFLINSRPKISGNLEVIFRFAFPGGGGPAVSVDIDGDVKGINNNIVKKNVPCRGNFIYLKDSFWGGKITLKERIDSDFLKNYDLVCKPLTTISLSESGYERIFQGIELRYSFNLNTEEDFSSIISIDIEKLNNKS
ncbi:MAG: alpha-amylase/4-alpha-glucanotransferase domain-containing protein [Candidatus Acidulodesulfobacterium sp.]